MILQNTQMMNTNQIFGMSENEFRKKKQRLKELSKNTFSTFNLLSTEKKLELSHQLKCSICNDKLEDSNFIYNDKLVCKNY